MKIVKKIFRKVYELLTGQTSIVEIDRDQQICNQLAARIKRKAVQGVLSTEEDVIATQLRERREMLNIKQMEVQNDR
ncbi:MAG: hypothetical protein HC853_00085 [Anaerolineae bacterium]|nr:hypothetical protein [Anaerolineae bacterium]